MIERENENISAVNTGCIPKVALVQVKIGEISASESYLENPATEPIADEHFCTRNPSDFKQQMAVENSGDKDSKPAIQEVKEKTHHRPKHVRSYSDCTGLSSASSDRQQNPPFIQVGNVSENVKGISHNTNL
jgi:hypothetical protein